MEVLLYILPVVLIGGLIYAYGGGREKIGSLKERVKKRAAQREREKRAKEIEAQPAPTDPDDVADAWSDL